MLATIAKTVKASNFRVARLAGMHAAIVCTAASSLLAMPRPCAAQMTARDFESLSETDKRAVLTSVLREREIAVRNVRAKSISRVLVLEYRGDKPGPVLSDKVGRFECETRRKDGNRWTSVNWYLPTSAHPNQKVVTSIDSSSGTARSVAEQHGYAGIYGAVDTKEDQLVRSSRFQYWFDGNYDRAANFPISFLLKNIGAVEFEGTSSDGGDIKISLQVDLKEGTPYHDKRTIWLDPRRGFMPVRMEWHWDFESSPPLDQDLTLEVKAMSEDKGVWFPTHFIETVVSTRSIEEGFCTQYETTASDIQVGVVTAEDLKVHFGKEVEIHDRITGTRTKAGKVIQSGDNLTPLVADGDTAPLRTWWVPLNVTLIAVLLAAIAWRKLKRS
ncbi:hypothetical protein [Lacipirellula parvula]|uniref:Uncharacterized protein n=1 Tax=Lacipirellula parvula TaxID=2650471 RepID=A0A5K7XKA5_9BACT|nr:hypothetical protein [Lacipirellula parvula]BBO35571.1 hypothetical protein PLANPX_5183 [Lacipirellula parvula]